MDIGLVLQSDPPAQRVIELARRADDSGYSHVWTFDSHVLWQEPFVVYSQILAQTSRVMVGPFVTNPLSREPSVTASLFATLNDTVRQPHGLRHRPRRLGPARARPQARRHWPRCPAPCGSSVTSPRAGRPTTTAPRSASRGCATASWRSGWPAYGPKALKMCGEEADGFILQCADPDIARWTIGTVRAAATAAGRDPADGDDLRGGAGLHRHRPGPHARSDPLVRRHGRQPRRGPRRTLRRLRETIPRALTDYIKAREGYDYAHHGKAGNPTTEFVPDEVVDRFCLLGPAGYHLERLQELREIGADNFSVYLMHDDADATLESYAKRVIGSV